MNNLAHGNFSIYPGAVAPELCDKIVNLGNQFEAACGKVYTLDGKGIINQESRNDKIAIIPHEKHTEWLYKEIWDIGYQLNQQNWNFSIEALEELQYSQYFENHFLGWHRDIVHEKARAAKSNRPELDRKISISIQLSDPSEYWGGMLEINQNESGDEEAPNLSDAQNRTGERDIHDLVRPKGSIIAFPSAIRHRVSPIRKGCRRALVAWIGGRA